MFKALIVVRILILIYNFTGSPKSDDHLVPRLWWKSGQFAKFQLFVDHHLWFLFFTYHTFPCPQTSQMTDWIESSSLQISEMRWLDIILFSLTDDSITWMAASIRHFRKPGDIFTNCFFTLASLIITFLANCLDLRIKPKAKHQQHQSQEKNPHCNAAGEHKFDTFGFNNNFKYNFRLMWESFNGQALVRKLVVIFRQCNYGIFIFLCQSVWYVQSLEIC